MKLSEYARKNNISYRTAHRHWKLGLIRGKQLPTGTIVVENQDEPQPPFCQSTVLYARVSNAENKINLEAQLSRLRNYASAKGYTIVREVKEIGSGLNDKRPLLENVLQSDNWMVLVAEDKDRVARFGLNYLSILLQKEGKRIEIINEANEPQEDLMQDFVSIITSFTARLYGLRRSKRKTELIISQLNNDFKEPCDS